MTDIKKIEKKIQFKISHNQTFIEYSELGIDYLKKISRIIKRNKGGLLLIDYGYTDSKMKNTLQAISNHKFANIFDNIGNVDIDNDSFKHIEALIQSMTPKERSNPKIIDHNRKKRIAKGAGREIQEINALLKQFEQMSKMMKMVQSGGASKLMSMMQNYKQ